MLVHARLAVVRTWTNGWFTTHRTKAVVRYKCIFGCLEADDDVQHYIRCPVLWPLVCTSAGTTQMFLDRNLVQRLCIHGYSSTDAWLLALAYQSTLRSGLPMVYRSCMLRCRVTFPSYSTFLSLFSPPLLKSLGFVEFKIHCGNLSRETKIYGKSVHA